MEFRPASHFWSRWLSGGWRWTQSHRLFRSLIEPLLQDRMSLLLVLAPLSLTASKAIPDVRLALGFLGIVPFSSIIYQACESLSTNLDPIPGELLVTLADNLIELTVGIVGLAKGEIRLIQHMIMGSVLCYSLLVIGSSFLAVGFLNKETRFNAASTSTITSLNVTALNFLAIATISHITGWPVNGIADPLGSRVAALVLIALYTVYLCFKLKTHASLWDEEKDAEEDETEEPNMATATVSILPIAAIFWLAISLTFVSLCSSVVFDNIRGSVWESHRIFLGFILFPFLANVKDYQSSCIEALKRKLDLSILWTLGSSMQIMLLTSPVLVIIGWILKQPMTFQFRPFEIIAVFFGSFVVNILVADGKTNYLEGAISIALYVIIALAAFLYTNEV
ncbi:Vacuolar calcium ion transporter [Lecanora helva]